MPLYRKRSVTKISRENFLRVKRRDRKSFTVYSSLFR